VVYNVQCRRPLGAFLVMLNEHKLADKQELNSNKRNIVYGLIVSFSILIVIELIGHTAYFVTHNYTSLWKFRSPHSKQFTPYGLSEYRPNIAAHMPGYPDNLQTDRYGFIHNGSDTEIKNSDYNVFVIGGSTVEGRGASSNKTTVPAYLEQMLNDTFEKNIQASGIFNRIHVVNAGSCGHMSYQEKSVTEGKILQQYNANMIIAFDGRNDAHYVAVYADHGWKPNWTPNYDKFTENINGLLFEIGLCRSFSLLLQRYSIIASSLSKLIVASTQGQEFLQNRVAADSLTKKAAKCYVDNHILMQTRCRLNSIKYFAFLQPTLTMSQKINMTEREEQLIDDWLGRSFKNTQIYYPGMSKFYQYARSETIDCPWFYDMSMLFKDSIETLYYDSVHYADTGNYLIAQELTQHISAAIQSDIDVKR